MKAAIKRKYGPAEILRVEELKKPHPKAMEVLVRVHATTVNRTDCAVLSGKPYVMRLFTGLLSPRKIIPGTDFAGEIVAVGKAVTSFAVGDKVFGFKDDGMSSQATHMTISEAGNITTFPDNISFRQAAASLEGAHYAYNFLKQCTFQKGQQVLINGATGAIGSALVQLVKQYQVKVTAVCQNQYSDSLKRLGADRIIDYTEEDFTKDPQRYDFVFDAVGKSTFAKCKPLLKPGGYYISSELGPGGQNLFLSLTTSWKRDKKVIFPFPTDIKGSMQYMKALLAKGVFTPLLDKDYPLNEIATAYHYVCSGKKIGNVTLYMEAD